ncbi:MAG: hypothetical protein ABI573_06600, partial [Chloroflexota bacterium]
ATWRARSLSRTASGLLAAGAVLTVLALFGASSGALASPIKIVPMFTGILMFPAGWAALGLSALRIDRAGVGNFEGAHP